MEAPILQLPFFPSFYPLEFFFNHPPELSLFVASLRNSFTATLSSFPPSSPFVPILHMLPFPQATLSLGRWGLEKVMTCWAVPPHGGKENYPTPLIHTKGITPLSSYLLSFLHST